MTRRWLFADQPGPHFLDGPDQPVLLVEPLRVCSPTSRPARALVRRLPGVSVLPERGFATTYDEFSVRVHQRRRLLLEDFHRAARRRHRLLMDGDEPTGGRWNVDADNREPPRAGAGRLDVADSWWPVEDDIDAEVRDDLDRWVRDDGLEPRGEDGPSRFAATHAEAEQALAHFVGHRLAAFGRYEDAILAGDPWMAHSLLSAPPNLGLYALTDWFHESFVDGYAWVMEPNVAGMSQHADGGLMATKPYAAGGAYINRMSDLCRCCRYDPKARVGERACPLTAGYWAFPHRNRNRDRLAANPRMAQARRGLDRLADLDVLLAQEAARGDVAP